jgi:hypothetical protein
LECLYVYAYLISDFLESQKYVFQKSEAMMLMCQRHFSDILKEYIYAFFCEMGEVCSFALGPFEIVVKLMYPPIFSSILS